MTTICIAHEVPAETVEKVSAFLTDTALRDPNWNGANFRIKRDDFTCIDGCDEYAGAALLNSIQKIISGEEDDNA